MKYTIILIATIFLIGISESEAVKKKQGAAAQSGKSTKAPPKGGKKAPPPPTVDDDEEEDEDAEVPEEDNEDEEIPDEEDEEDEEDEVETPVKKKGSPTRKPPTKKAPAQKKGAVDDKVPTLADLKNQVASMNPANLIGALQNTPIDKLKEVLPQMKELTDMLNGTPLGPIFNNLTSLLGNNSPQVWNTLFKLFPDFLTIIIGNASQLQAVATTALGRAGQSFVDLTDALFNGGKDVLDRASAIPGVNLVTGPLGLGLDLLHTGLVTPLDAITDEVKANGKRQMKRAERSLRRTRSGNAGIGSILGL